MVVKLSFCKMIFSKNYVICIIKDGEIVSTEKSNLQTKVILDHFQDRQFVYITHRIHSYSVDPIIYSETSKINNLAGFVVVSKNYRALSNTEIEKRFLNNKPFKSFTKLDEAIDWAELLLIEKKQI